MIRNAAPASRGARHRSQGIGAVPARLWWLAAAPLVGFALAGRVFHLGADGDWELWKAALLGGLLMIPFAVGAALGVRAVRGG